MNKRKLIVLVPNLLLAGAAFSIEGFLLHAILAHPAAGSGNVPVSLFAKFLGFASAPFLAALWICTVDTAASRVAFLQKHLIVLSIIGIGFCFLALRQFSHATPGFLMLGYAGQWAVVVWQVLSSYRNTKRSSH